MERGEGKEKEGEKHRCVVASHAPPAEDLAHDPGLCPDWESNWQPFGSQAGTQFTESHQLGPLTIFDSFMFHILLITLFINDCLCYVCECF